MRGSTLALVAAGAVGLCLLIYAATGGRFMFFFLPLLFGLPLLRRR